LVDGRGRARARLPPAARLLRVFAARDVPHERQSVRRARPRVADALAAADAAPRTAQLGMWVFLGTEVLFFGGLFVAYAVGRAHWPHGFAVASRHTDVVLGTVNTAVLLTSSAIVAFAVACADHPAQRRWTALALWATAALGVVFLAIKGVEYVHEWSEHLFPLADFALTEPGAELFWVLYFVMTILHSVHLLIGIVG